MAEDPRTRERSPAPGSSRRPQPPDAMRRGLGGGRRAEPRARTTRQGPNDGRRALPGAPVRHDAPMGRTLQLSATDISALVTMKNVAKCDIWCELQNLVSHQLFECKLSPKPLRPRARLPGRRSKCALPRRAWREGSGSWPPVPVCGEAGGRSAGGRRSRRVALSRWHGIVSPVCVPGPCAAPSDPSRAAHGRTRYGVVSARNMTSGQAGAPAEFKHINKRWKRNLRGFP